jgi:hypothetical protein
MASKLSFFFSRCGTNERPRSQQIVLLGPLSYLKFFKKKETQKGLARVVFITHLGVLNGMTL